METTEASSRYRELYGENYTCPYGRRHGLKTCLRHHLCETIDVIGKGSKAKIHVKQGFIDDSNTDILKSFNVKVSNSSVETWLRIRQNAKRT